MSTKPILPFLEIYPRKMLTKVNGDTHKDIVYMTYTPHKMEQFKLQKYALSLLSVIGENQ